jgi:hypothetical protein
MDSSEPVVVYATDSSQQGAPTPAPPDCKPIVSDPATGEAYYQRSDSGGGDGGGSPVLGVGAVVTISISSTMLGKVLPCGVPPIGVVTAIWKTSAGSWMVEARLLFRPGQRGAPARKPFHGAAELIASDTFVECTAPEVTAGVVSCESADEFSARSAFPDTAYYCRERVSPASPDSSVALGRSSDFAVELVVMTLSPRNRRVADLLEQETQPPPPTPKKRKRKMLITDETSREADVVPAIPEQPPPSKRAAKKEEEGEEGEKPTTAAMQTVTADELVKIEAKKFSVMRSGSLLSWVERAAAGKPSPPHVKIARMARLDVAPANETSHRHRAASNKRSSPAAALCKIAIELRQPKIKSFVSHEEELGRFQNAEKPTAAATEEEDDEEKKTDKTDQGSDGASFVVSDDHKETGEADGEEGDGSAVVAAAAPRKGDGPLPWLFTLRQAFEVYLQFLASSIIDREFREHLEESDDPDSARYFTDSVSKVERELLSRKEGLVTSTVWLPELQQDLQSRPIFRSCFEKAIAEQYTDCEACNRSRHPAIFKVTLSGRPYSSSNVWRGDLSEAIETGSGGDEEEEEEVVYRLGRLCH